MGAKFLNKLCVHIQLILSSANGDALVDGKQGGEESRRESIAVKPGNCDIMGEAFSLGDEHFSSVFAQSTHGGGKFWTAGDFETNVGIQTEAKTTKIGRDSGIEAETIGATNEWGAFTGIIIDSSVNIGPHFGSAAVVRSDTYEITIIVTKESIRRPTIGMENLAHSPAWITSWVKLVGEKDIIAVHGQGDISQTIVWNTI